MENIKKALEEKIANTQKEGINPEGSAKKDVNTLLEPILKDDNAKNTLEDLSLQLDNIALVLQLIDERVGSLEVRISALESKE